MARLNEKAIVIDGPQRLEGLLFRAGEPAGGLVVTHPHPLYGGSMLNNVVEALVQAGAEAGWSTLRFNFRGVGRSSGGFDHGRGEAEDLLAGLDHLSGLGLDRLVVAGYSFGAWVAAAADFGRRPVIDQIWVAPPVGMLAIDPAGVALAPGLIIHGGRDAFCPPDQLAALVEGFGPRQPVLVGIDEADHFFLGFEDLIRRETARHLSR